MANQSTPLSNKPVASPTLRDLLNLHTKEIMLALNCHAIATIQSFDATTQMVKATVNYGQTYFQKGQNGTYANINVPYPTLIDCPIISLSGGPWSLTFPISEGDQCLILFNDRDMDNWIANGRISNTGQVATGRLHSFSDGMALVGLNVIPSYDTTRAVLKNNAGGALVGVADTLVKIANNSTTLNTLLQDLVTAIKALTTNVTVTGVSTGLGTASGTGAVDSGSQSALAAIATDIAGLLE